VKILAARLSFHDVVAFCRSKVRVSFLLLIVENSSTGADGSVGVMNMNSVTPGDPAATRIGIEVGVYPPIGVVLLLGILPLRVLPLRVLPLRILPLRILPLRILLLWVCC